MIPISRTILTEWSPYLWFPSWSPDGTRLTLATKEEPQKIQILHISSGVQTPLVGHEAGVNAASWAPNSDIIATSAWDGTVRLWTATGELMHTIRLAKDASVECVCWQPRTNCMTAVCSDGSVVHLSNDLSHTHFRLELRRKLFCAAWKPDASRLIVTTELGWTAISADGRVLEHVDLGAAAIEVSWTADGELATVTCDNGTVWTDSGTGKRQQLLSLRGAGRAAHWQSSVLLAVGDSLGNLAVLSRSGKLLWQGSYNNEIIALRWRPGSRSILAATRGFEARLLDLKELEPDT